MRTHVEHSIDAPAARRHHAHGVIEAHEERDLLYRQSFGGGCRVRTTVSIVAVVIAMGAVALSTLIFERLARTA